MYLCSNVLQNLCSSGCGGVYNQPSGTVTSPGYPNRYPAHMYCVYHVNTYQPDRGLRLTFDDFDVENVASRRDCGFDSVSIYESYESEQKHGKKLGT